MGFWGREVSQTVKLARVWSYLVVADYMTGKCYLFADFHLFEGNRDAGLFASGQNVSYSVL